MLCLHNNKLRAICSLVAVATAIWQYTAICCCTTRPQSSCFLTSWRFLAVFFFFNAETRNTYCLWINYLVPCLTTCLQSCPRYCKPFHTKPRTAGPKCCRQTTEENFKYGPNFTHFSLTSEACHLQFRIYFKMLLITFKVPFGPVPRKRSPGRTLLIISNLRLKTDADLTVDDIWSNFRVWDKIRTDVFWLLSWVIFKGDRASYRPTLQK